MSESNLPTVSVVVLTCDGKGHLGGCLGSLRRLDYPDDKLEIILVDNGSTDGSVELVRGKFPEVKVIENGSNVGFARGNNIGAQQATGQYVAFLNDDTRVHRGWLKELLRPLLEDEKAACSSSLILNWNEGKIDYAGGASSYLAEGFQLYWGKPAQQSRNLTQTETLFPCGGAMLVEREVFLRAGGFDDSYFIFYEDLDLGWRLWNMGYKVVFVPTAHCFHRHHGTVRRFTEGQWNLLFTRNRLLTIMKNYEEDNLYRTLSSALILTLRRMFDCLGIERTTEVFEPRALAALPTSGKTFPSEFVSYTAAITDIVDNLHELKEQRVRIQAQRTVGDAQTLSLFRRAFFASDTNEGFQDLHRGLVKNFGVDEVFSRCRGRKILVFAGDFLPLPGLPTTGSGIRTWGIVKGLESRGFSVSVSLNGEMLRDCDHLPQEARDNAWGRTNQMMLIEKHQPDVVVFAHWCSVHIEEKLDIPTVIDLQGPHFLERRFQGLGSLSLNARDKIDAFQKADFFVCPGERQRFYFTTWLALSGFRPEEDVIAVMPTSMPPELPIHQRSDEITFVYSGVAHPWQDPTIALETLMEKLEEHGKGLVKMLGGKHPVTDLEPGSVGGFKEKYSGHPGLIDLGFISHDSALQEYATAAVAVDLMKRNDERELASPNRTIEYLWCGLPVIHNDYSEISSLIRSYRAGWCLDPEDRAAIADLIDRILSDPSQLEEYSRNAQRLAREKFTWDVTIEPLAKFCTVPHIRRPMVGGVTLEGSFIGGGMLERAIWSLRASRMYKMYASAKRIFGRFG